MVSRPPFTVEIQKGEGDRIAFQCAFPDPMAEEMQAQEDDYGIVILSSLKSLSTFHVILFSSGMPPSWNVSYQLSRQ